MLTIGYLLDPVGPVLDHLVGRDLLFGIGLEEVVLLALFDPHLAGGRVEGDEDLLAGLVAGLLDGLEDHLEGLFVALEGRGEAALVADGGVVALVLQHAS